MLSLAIQSYHSTNQAYPVQLTNNLSPSFNWTYQQADATTLTFPAFLLNSNWGQFTDTFFHAFNTLATNDLYQTVSTSITAQEVISKKSIMYPYIASHWTNGPVSQITSSGHISDADQNTNWLLNSNIAGFIFAPALYTTLQHSSTVPIPNRHSNLILNPSFEYGSTLWHKNSGISSVDFDQPIYCIQHNNCTSFSRNHAQDGDYFIKIVNTNATSSQAGIYSDWIKPRTNLANNSFELFFSIKNHSGTPDSFTVPAGVQILNGTAITDYLQSVATEVDWQRKSLIISLPNSIPDTAKLRVFIGAIPSSTRPIYLDNISLIEIDAIIPPITYQQLIEVFNQTGSYSEDLNKDGVVNIFDLNQLISPPLSR